MPKPNQDVKVINTILGQVGLSAMIIVTLPDGQIQLVEQFYDPNYENKEINGVKAPPLFTVTMAIRSEYVPQLLRVLLDNGFRPAKIPMDAPNVHLR